MQLNLYRCMGGLEKEIPRLETLDEEQIKILLPSCDVRKWPDRCQGCSKHEGWRIVYDPITFRKLRSPPCCVWKLVPDSEKSKEGAVND